jgi:hypothetical protein
VDYGDSDTLELLCKTRYHGKGKLNINKGLENTDTAL